MARKYQAAVRTGHTILVIDDSTDILESSKQLLEGEGHRVLTAEDGPTGIAMAKKEHPHLILCDYFMPEMTGEEVVRLIREADSLVQIILVTGYAGEKPARVMMQQLDIQGYHDKGEGAERLLLWVDSALKAYRSAIAAEKHRVGLQYILDVTPDLHRLQPLDELLHGLLWQVEGLVGAENSFLATYSSEEIGRAASENEVGDLEGFVALLEDSAVRSALEIRVGTGRFRSGIRTDSLPEPERTLVREAVEAKGISFTGGVSVLPLRLGEEVLGAIFIDRRPGYERDRDLLEIFACQAAAAIQSALLYGQNEILYDLATKDPTTGVFLRGHGMQQFHQQLKRSHRSGSPLSVLMMDVDKFKQVNDTHGHIAGDTALRAVGELLQDCVRETDIVARYGGDEFMAVLWDTPPEGARVVAERILQRAQDLAVVVEGVRVPFGVSVGCATIRNGPEGPQFHLLRPDIVDQVASELISTADAALYSAKGKGIVANVPLIQWGAGALAIAAA
ncbi:MAG: diguanylate cyclase [Gemmatimonadetes bacterium]|nr:diguanylate cyclase [Gemmatimonadota bacterium]